MYCQCKYMPKDDRLQIRVDPAQKRLLEQASEAAHANVSTFVLQSAVARAEDLLLERQTIRLNAEAAAAFTTALERPASVNERLAARLSRPRKFRWLD